MAFGILSSPSVFPFTRCFLLRSYTSLENYLCSGVGEFPLFPSVKPSMSCHRYCFAAHVNLILCLFWYWHNGITDFKFCICWACISFAMSMGCLSMLLFLSFVLSRGGLDASLNI
jgi:hypothetical protein